jgi:hypothetical protein
MAWVCLIAMGYALTQGDGGNVALLASIEVTLLITAWRSGNRLPRVPDRRNES